MTLLPASAFPVEVSLDHYFVSYGKRYAVVFVMHHGEPIHYVREEAHLTPCTGPSENPS